MKKKLLLIIVSVYILSCLSGCNEIMSTMNKINGVSDYYDDENCVFIRESDSQVYYEFSEELLLFARKEKNTEHNSYVYDYLAVKELSHQFGKNVVEGDFSRVAYDKHCIYIHMDSYFVFDRDSFVPVKHPDDYIYDLTEYSENEFNEKFPDNDKLPWREL